MSGAAPKMCSLPLVCHEVSFLPMIPMSRVVMHLHLPCKWSSHLGSSNAKSENSATGHIEFLDFINAAAFPFVRNPMQHARQRRFIYFRSPTGSGDRFVSTVWQYRSISKMAPLRYLPGRVAHDGAQNYSPCSPKTTLALVEGKTEI